MRWIVKLKLFNSPADKQWPRHNLITGKLAEPPNFGLLRCYRGLLLLAGSERRRRDQTLKRASSPTERP